jgi:ribonuclease Z
MQPSFHPRLVNDPFDDPGLFIPFLFERRAIIFDLGDIHSLSTRDILKISHVFVTHTHMDHMVGFDRLLRLFLGREKTLYLYGPEGFLANVEGKLAGYSWNLVKHYKSRFCLHAVEVTSEFLTAKQYLCREGFLSEQDAEVRPFDSILLDDSSLQVSAVILDHRIPCLGFSIKERFHVNIIKDALFDLGLKVGPWLKTFKEALFTGTEPDSEFEIGHGGDDSKKNRFRLGELSNRIAIITPGQKVTYIADAAYIGQNADRIIEFAAESDHLFIESAFLEADREIAEEKYHLTARQAGEIAGKAGVKRFTLFHFSPRYKGREHLLRKEADAAYASFKA